MAVIVFEMFKGNDKTMYVQVLNESQLPYNLTGVGDIEWVVYSGESVVFKKTLKDKQVFVVDEASGKIAVDVNNKDSDIKSSTYAMVLRIITGEGKIHTVLTGNFVIKNEY